MSGTRSSHHIESRASTLQEKAMQVGLKLKKLLLLLLIIIIFEICADCLVYTAVAGKYVPELAELIYDMNKDPSLFINLKGFLVWSPFIYKFFCLKHNENRKGSWWDEHNETEVSLDIF